MSILSSVQPFIRSFNSAPGREKRPMGKLDTQNTSLQFFTRTIPSLRTRAQIDNRIGLQAAFVYNSSVSNTTTSLRSHLRDPAWDYLLWPKALGVQEHRVNAQTTFRVRAVDLRHGELQLQCLIRFWDHKITCMVQNPAPRLIQIALR
jgi:hypothetical protein